MRVYQNTITINTTPQDLWGLWTQPQKWSNWDPTIQSATADQTLRLGVSGTLTTGKGKGHPFKVVLCDPASCLMVAYQFSVGVEINIKRSWEKTHEGIQVTQEVTLIGPMAALAGRMQKDAFVQMTNQALQGMQRELEGHIPVTAPQTRLI